MFLITGFKGQLGIELSNLLTDKAIKVDIDTLDITDELKVKEFFLAHDDIDAVINCAAYTAVDKAEDEEDKANLVNNIGVKNLAKYAKNIIHVSTDYVFDGKAYLPYSEDNTPNPQSAYGRTKLAGEKAAINNAQIAIIIRTAWLYSAHGNNFVKTMLKLGSTKPSLGVVYDQIGTPTFARDLAKAIVAIVESDKFTQALKNKQPLKEIYHFTNEGIASWYDFAQAIMTKANLPCLVKPIRSEQYPTKAKRPFYSVLDKAKIKRDFNLEIPHWHDALMECMLELMDNDSNDK